MIKRLYGSAVALLITSAVVFLLFGDMLKSPGSYYFSGAEGRFTPYYSALYHSRYDTLALRSIAMNYPYGEEISFTETPSLLSNPIRFVSRHLTDITASTVALINLSMLISVILASLFIFLIFAELGVAWWFGAPVAAGIALLSPQAGNMAGLLALSWSFWIPLLVWMFIRFERSRNIFYTLAIGGITFAAGLLHIYYIAIFLVVTVGYWFIRFYWYRKERTFWYRDIHHIFLQFVLPVLLLQFLTLIHSDVADRSAWPEGLYTHMAKPSLLFLPHNQPWAWVGKVWGVAPAAPETAAYIGTAALVGLLFALFLGIRRLIKRAPVFSVTSDVTLNVVFWVSLLSLLFSFGLPMVLGLKTLPDYLGPLRQVRDLSRFSWLFYYVFNIVLFTGIYTKAFTTGSHWYRKVIAFAAVSILLADAFFHQHTLSGRVLHSMESLYERYPTKEVDAWLSETDVSSYQAIAPLPYFHTGSENIWLAGTPEVKDATMLLSLQTGLPTIAADLSRTSISQTFNLFALYTDPLQRLELPDFLPDERPLLLMVMHNHSPDEASARLILNSRLLTSTPKFTLYELSVQTMRRLNLMYQESVTERYRSSMLVEEGDWLVSNPEAYYFVNGFDSMIHETALEGEGMLTFPSRMPQLVWHDTLTTLAPGTNLVVSFWVKDYRTDGNLRTSMELQLFHNGMETSYMGANFFEHIKAFSGNWALVEFPFTTTHEGNEVKLMVQNGVRPKMEHGIDQLMVREQGLDLFRQSGRWLELNNRRVIIRQQL